MRGTVLLSASGILVVLLASGAALAAAREANVIDCPFPQPPPITDEQQPPDCVGTDAADTIYGADNPDYGETIWGLGGSDVVHGNVGMNAISGDKPGDPTVKGNDTLYGAESGDDLSGGYGDDVLYGRGNWDILEGGYGRDRMYGGGYRDTLYADSGADLVAGGQGDDALQGEEGADRLRAGEGDDTVYAAGWADEWNDRPTDRKKDVIKCGAGQDSVWYKEGEDEVAADCEDLHQYLPPPAGG